jgi:pimeloyl-ACP methyl ester carboxylesterase
MRILSYLIVAVGVAAAVSPLTAGSSQTIQTRATASDSSTLAVFLHSRPIGTEQVTVITGDDGWRIQASGRLGPPIYVANERVEVRYGPDWSPRDLNITATRGDDILLVRTIVSGTSAATTVTRGTETTSRNDQVTADTLLLSNTSFAGYEALAARLTRMQPGGELRALLVPESPITIQFKSVSEDRIQTAARLVKARRHQIVIMNPGAPLPGELWTDERGRLVRLSLPGAGLEVVREDIASVSARRQTVRHPGDVDVVVPAAGFNLAATLTMPRAHDRAVKGRLPAIILVPGSEPRERDEVVAGVPIFGQIAGALADAGFAVVRYDKRGVGQSGGRHESATIGDYADDVRATVRFLRERKDIDDKRIAIVGYGEGGWIALQAAAKHDRIAAVVVLGTAGTPGTELVLEQQQAVLEGMSIPAAEKSAKIELQKKINQAVLTGTGWSEVPRAVRSQADTPWFQSVLMFDPAFVITKVQQPLLIVHGELDTQVAPHHAGRLVEVAGKRKKSRGQDLVRFPNVGHSFVASSDEAHVIPVLSKSIVEWLDRQLMSKKPRSGALGVPAKRYERGVGAPASKQMSGALGVPAKRYERGAGAPASKR